MYAKLKYDITKSFTNIGIPSPGPEYLNLKICLLMLFVEIKFSRKFPNLQYRVASTDYDFHMTSENHF